MLVLRLIAICFVAATVQSKQFCEKLKKCPIGSFVGPQGLKGEKGAPGTFDSSVLEAMKSELKELKEIVATIVPDLTTSTEGTTSTTINTETSADTGPCAENNGGCKDSEICFPMPGGRRCTCPYCKCNGIGIETKLCKCPQYCNAEEELIRTNNCYEYTISPSKNSWKKGRKYCKGIGGDLAMHGMKSEASRRKIVTDLDIDFGIGYNIWIGMNDIQDEGHWRWVDESSVRTNESNWNSQPNVGHSGNCGYMYTKNLKSQDFPCKYTLLALCEINRC